MDLLKKSGGDAGLGAIAKQVGLSTDDAGKLLEALSPALTHGLQRQSASEKDLSGFKKALESGHHQRYLAQPDLIGQEDTLLDGNKILGHLFGSKDVSRNVAAHAAEQTGFDSGLIKKALPMLAAVVMGAASKASNSGKDISNATTDGLGSLAGILLSKDGDSSIGDIINLARKFF